MEELAPNGRWHDYFINVRGLEVSYLDEKEARRLLTNPITDFRLDYAKGAVDEGAMAATATSGPAEDVSEAEDKSLGESAADSAGESDRVEADADG